MDALARLGGQAWFRLGDTDLATHLYRTQRIHEGATLSQITHEISSSLGVRSSLLPMSDDPVKTYLTLASGEEVGFQDYFVRFHHDVPVSAIRFEGASRAVPSPGVIESLSSADTVIVCPSNPLVSIGPILSVPGISDTVAARRDSVVAVSPIIAGRALKGPADRLMSELSHEPSAAGVARLYAHLAATMIIDVADAALADDIEATGMSCVVTDTVMSTPDKAMELAKRAVDASGSSHAA